MEVPQAGLVIVMLLSGTWGIPLLDRRCSTAGLGAPLLDGRCPCSMVGAPLLDGVICYWDRGALLCCWMGDAPLLDKGCFTDMQGFWTLQCSFVE